MSTHEYLSGKIGLHSKCSDKPSRVKRKSGGRIKRADGGAAPAPATPSKNRSSWFDTEKIRGKEDPEQKKKREEAGARFKKRMADQDSYKKDLDGWKQGRRTAGQYVEDEPKSIWDKFSRNNIEPKTVALKKGGRIKRDVGGVAPMPAPTNMMGNNNPGIAAPMPAAPPVAPTPAPRNIQQDKDKFKKDFQDWSKNATESGKKQFSDWRKGRRVYSEGQLDNWKKTRLEARKKDLDSWKQSRATAGQYVGDTSEPSLAKQGIFGHFDGFKTGGRAKHAAGGAGKIRKGENK